jgi:hypothetical protein
VILFCRYVESTRNLVEFQNSLDSLSALFDTEIVSKSYPSNDSVRSEQQLPKKSMGNSNPEIVHVSSSELVIDTSDDADSSSTANNLPPVAAVHWGSDTEMTKACPSYHSSNLLHWLYRCCHWFKASHNLLFCEMRLIDEDARMLDPSSSSVNKPTTSTPTTPGTSAKSSGPPRNQDRIRAFSDAVQRHPSSFKNANANVVASSSSAFSEHSCGEQAMEELLEALSNQFTEVTVTILSPAASGSDFADFYYYHGDGKDSPRLVGSPTERSMPMMSSRGGGGGNENVSPIASSRSRAGSGVVVAVPVAATAANVTAGIGGVTATASLLAPPPVEQLSLWMRVRRVMHFGVCLLFYKPLCSVLRTCSALLVPVGRSLPHIPWCRHDQAAP